MHTNTQALAGYTQAHFTGGHDAAVTDILKELTSNQAMDVILE